jgi:GST-like protein
MAKMRLFGEPGWGSTLVEAQLDWYGLAYEFERVGDLFKTTEGKSTESKLTDGRQRLAAANPLAQIPTLVLANGDVLTESAAITLWLAESQGADSLVPRAGDTARAPFLRWLVYLVANVYPTYTYGDDPARFVAGEDAQRSFGEHVEAYRKRLYTVLEGIAGTPWFLGERFSALDIYVRVMNRWRPKPEWFAVNTPKLAAIAARTEQVPQLAACWQRNTLTN